jgi:isopropylmalate/homocitrate/citramalate synthase
MSELWKTEKWYTSPWNFTEEVAKSYNFAPKIKFHDVSLRDGEQQSGLIFTKDQKVAIAEKLAELGIHRIEAGMPAVSKQDEAAIREIVKRNMGPEIFAFARCVKADVQLAADCGVKGIVVEIPSSEHIVKYAYKWDMQRAINASIEATQYAKELGLYTVFFPIDATRADIGWFIELIQKVATEGHMDALGLVDTFGALNPSAIYYLVKKVKEKIKVPLEAHFHDDFGMGAANTVMALAAGADVAHTTISGIGERAGNAPYEDVALTLLTMYGVDTGLKYDKIYGLTKFLQQISGLKVRQNRGIIGDDIANIESGIVADWYRNVKGIAPLELSPYLYSLTGHPDTKVVIGKNSGIATVEIYLEQLGIKCDSADVKKRIVTALKEKTYEKGCLLTVEELGEVATKIINQG